MARVQHLGRMFLLSALMLGMNVLGLLHVMHSRHPAHARANVGHGQHSHSRRASRNGDRQVGDTLHDFANHVDDHVATQKPAKMLMSAAVGIPSAAARMFAPEFVAAPLASAPEVAVGSAPRGPCGARAPPLV